ncbi:MAG: DUF2919 domain-containing protein [Glaciecola sp.]
MLKYPLKYYDEAGRMKPPIVVYFILLFVSRGLLVLIISLSFREDSELLLRLFYPQPYHFYLSLSPIIPALMGLYLVSKRNILWENEQFSRFKMLPWLMAFALLLDASMQTYMLYETHFAYSLSHGLSLLIAVLCMWYLVKSQYLKTLFIDWQTP